MTELRISKLNKMFNEINYDFTWEFYGSIQKEIYDAERFKKYLKDIFLNNTMPSHIFCKKTKY